MRRFVDIPPMWLLASAALAFLLARTVPLVVIEFPGWLGWGIFALGLTWAGAAVVLFTLRKTPVEPHRTPEVLLTEGPFRLNRNPIYTGMTVMLLGWAVVLGAASAFVLVVLFPILITMRFVRPEEEALKAAFGGRADAYLARTRRW